VSDDDSPSRDVMDATIHGLATKYVVSNIHVYNATVATYSAGDVDGAE